MTLSLPMGVSILNAVLDTQAKQGFVFMNNYNENELIAFTYDENPSEGPLNETKIGQILDVAFNIEDMSVYQILFN